MSFRDALFAGSYPRQIIPVEWVGGTTYVRTMTVEEKDDYEVNASKDNRFRCRIVLICCCKEDGSPEFTNRDLPRLNEFEAYVLEPIVDAAIKLNKIGTKDAEYIRKN